MTKQIATTPVALMVLAHQIQAEQIPSASPEAILANHGGNIDTQVSSGFVAQLLVEEFYLDEFTAANIAGTTESIGDAVAMAFVVQRKLAPQRIADLDDTVEPRTPEALLYKAIMFAAAALPDFTVGELNLRFADFRVEVFGAGPGAYLSLADAVRTGEVEPADAWLVLTREQSPPLIMA